MAETPTGRTPLPRWLRLIGRIALFLVVAALLGPFVVPPLLDSVHYRGPPSDHFDGARFFNPDVETRPQATRIQAANFFLRKMLRSEAVAWPDKVQVTPGYPAAAAIPCPLRPARATENWARCVAHPDPARMFVTWIGHATVLVQVDGLNILTDPIYSERAGVMGLIGPKRVRAPGIRFDDLPKIDLVLLSHSHWDHLDVPTLKRLWARDRPLIVTGLGNDDLLARHGIGAKAADWSGRVAVRPGVEVIVERVHHWGTRFAADRNRTLWAGFTVTLPHGNLFFAGDTGLGDGSWPRVAARDGPFRLAIIPIGAFKPRGMMVDNHIGPVEAVTVFETLAPTRALAVHWGTFHLSEEGLYEPPALLHETLAKEGIAPGRFRALEVGRSWEIPALAPGRR